jgi:hypothetical protein
MDSTVVRGGPEKVRLCAGELLPGLQLLILSMHPGQLALAILGNIGFFVQFLPMPNFFSTAAPPPPLFMSVNLPVQVYRQITGIPFPSLICDL